MEAKQVQVNGRVRNRIDVPVGIWNAEAEALARESEVVPGRLVNVVVK